MEKFTEQDLEILILNKVGSRYVFASALGNDNTVEFQLMPDSLDDGFFNWYTGNYKDNQFYKTKYECSFHFINAHGF